MKKLSHISRLKKPKPRFDPVIHIRAGTRLPNGKITRSSYETEDECFERDAKQVNSSKRVLRNPPPYINQRRVRRLIKALSYTGSKPRPSRAGARYQRQSRRKIIGGLAKAAANYPGDVWFVTIFCDRWQRTPEELTPAAILAIKKQMTNWLNRPKWKDRKGFAALFIDGEKEYATGLFNLQLHGLVGGADFRKAFKALNKSPLFHCRRGSDAVQFLPLEGSIRLIGYCVTPFWNGRYVDEKGKDQKSPAMREPYRTHYMSVVNALSYRDMYVFKNISIKNGSFVISDKG